MEDMMALVSGSNAVFEDGTSTPRRIDLMLAPTLIVSKHAGSSKINRYFGLQHGFVQWRNSMQSRAWQCGLVRQLRLQRQICQEPYPVSS